MVLFNFKIVIFLFCNIMLKSTITRKANLKFTSLFENKYLVNLVDCLETDEVFTASSLRPHCLKCFLWLF